MNDKLRGELSELMGAVLLLRDREEAYAFFEDLCTVAELHAMAQRWAVARLLHGGYGYQAVAERTGASSATISRVKRSLLYGADGYRRILERPEDSQR